MAAGSIAGGDVIGAGLKAQLALQALALALLCVALLLAAAARLCGRDQPEVEEREKEEAAEEEDQKKSRLDVTLDPTAVFTPDGVPVAEGGAEGASAEGAAGRGEAPGPPLVFAGTGSRIFAFVHHASGRLTPVGLPTPAGGSPSWVTSDPTGARLFVCDVRPFP
jgi:hypothetical protein